MTTDRPDYYRILGVSPQATADEIHAAFDECCAEFTSEERQAGKNSAYRQLLQAYEVLSDENRRAIYDSLLAESTSPSLEIEAELSRDQIGISDKNQLVYLRVGVYPPREKQQGQRPLNLCLVVDHSTSMQGARLDQMKGAVELIIEKLGPDDTISLISFSDRAEVIIPATEVAKKQLLAAKIRRVMASGGTEIYQGLRTGFAELKKVSLARHTNHLILLTDGHTYGDEHQSIALAQEMAKQGIGISAFGLGAEWNDQFLDRLVTPSGGQSDFIETPEQILSHLQERIKGLGEIYARSVRFKQNFPGNITLQYGFKLTPFTQPLNLNSDEIQLGDIEGRSPLSFLFELRIEPQPIETRIKIPVHVEANIPAQRSTPVSLHDQVQCVVLNDPSETGEPSPALVKAVRILTMYRMNEKAWQEAEQGQLDQATRRMRHLTTRLLEAGETKLAQHAKLEVERLQRMGSISLEGRKTIKYGTRALMSEALWLEDDDSM